MIRTSDLFASDTEYVLKITIWKTSKNNYNADLKHHDNDDALVLSSDLRVLTLLYIKKPNEILIIKLTAQFFLSTETFKK